MENQIAWGQGCVKGNYSFYCPDLYAYEMPMRRMFTLKQNLIIIYIVSLFGRGAIFLRPLLLEFRRITRLNFTFTPLGLNETLMCDAVVLSQ